MKGSWNDRRVNVEIDGSKWHINASMSRSTRQCRDRWIEVAHQRVNVEIDASMSRSMDRSGTSTRQCRDRRVDVEIDGSKWHINASMSRSTRRCRDRWIEVAHQRVNVEIDASLSRSMNRSGTSTRQCRDQRVDVEIDGSISGWSKRLDVFGARVSYLQVDFKQTGWANKAGAAYDCILTIQAVHELRHKRHAPQFYNECNRILKN